MGKFDGILLATDLDSTLLDAGRRISEGNRRAIEYFEREGGFFTYVTGRTPFGTRVILDQMTPRIPFGCLNGGGIYDANANQYVWRAELDPRAEELIDFVHARFPEVGIELCGFDTAWVLCRNRIIDEHMALERLDFADATFGEVKDRGLAKALLMTEADRIGGLAEAIASHPLASEFAFVQSAEQYYEILPRGASKGALLSRLAGMLGISPDKTVAVGDNHNDASMIRAAHLGVAVANATPPAKDAADLVLDVTNEQDAIACLIARLESDLHFTKDQNENMNTHTGGTDENG